MVNGARPLGLTSGPHWAPRGRHHQRAQPPRPRRDRPGQGRDQGVGQSWSRGRGLLAVAGVLMVMVWVLFTWAAVYGLS